MSFLLRFTHFSWHCSISYTGNGSELKCIELYRVNVIISLFYCFRTNIEENRRASKETVTTALPATTEAPGIDVYLDRDLCMYIYVGFVVAITVTAIVRSLFFFFVCMRASARLHDNMFNSITRARMRFFDTNPSGMVPVYALLWLLKSLQVLGLKKSRVCA